MSDDEQLAAEATEQTNQAYLTAEYKDGRLQIVEVTPYEIDKEGSILPDVQSETEGEQTKYLQVLDKDGLVQLDLLNLTLVKCEDGEEAYRLVTSSEAGGSADLSTVTCVLQASEGDEETDGQESYVMVEGSDDSMPVLLEPASGTSSASSASSSAARPKEAAQTPDTDNKQNSQNAGLSPVELLQKAKALKKARAILSSVMPVRKRGRRRKADLPPTQELMCAPGFKMYLYCCKMCPFRCNAVKELADHKAKEHASGSSKYRTGRVPYTALQCPRCPHRAASSAALAKHHQMMHMKANDENTNMDEMDTVTITNKLSLDSAEVEEADVLVCGACGFESADKPAFRHHIVHEHGANPLRVESAFTLHCEKL